jgi:copper chaperone CopZ
LKPYIALILAAGPLCAEFLHVEQALSGLDCISCAESVGKNLKKIKGVEAASFRTQDSVAVLELKPGNSVQLQDIRDRVKGMGYTPKDAKVTVRGQARMDGGKWTLRVVGAETDYPLDLSAGEGLAGQLGPEGITVIEGSIGPAPAPLKVTAVRRGE